MVIIKADFSTLYKYKKLFRDIIILLVLSFCYYDKYQCFGIILNGLDYKSYWEYKRYFKY